MRVIQPQSLVEKLKPFNLLLHDVWLKILYSALHHTESKASPESAINLDSSSLFASRLGLHLTREVAEQISPLGIQSDWPTGATLCRRGDRERVLHVILDGEIDYGSGWLGSGGYLGELGFLLGVPRTTDLQARVPTSTWSVGFDMIQKHPRLATLLIIALTQELPTRLRKFHQDKALPAECCDHDHPAIRSLAQMLSCNDDTSTAKAIWRFVRAMPYRFGPWWQTASETLRLGWGMCTTKSNLEVALFRAAGLEAGFVQRRIDAHLLTAVVPSNWQERVHQQVYHIMGAVKLQGRWHVADSAFPEIIFAELVKGLPRATQQILKERLYPLGVGHPYNPLALCEGRDPFDEVVIPSLSDSMRKRSSFDLDQFELLNLVNDKLQKTQLHEETPWLTRIQSCLQQDPQGAMQMSLAAAGVLASELHQHIEVRHAL